MKQTKEIYTIIFFILLLLAHPFYMKQSVYEWIYKSTLGNDKAEIEICANKPIKFSQATKDIEDIDIKTPEEKNGQICTRVRLLIDREWQKYDISFDSNNLFTNLVLRAPEEWGNHVIQPLSVDYRELFINGERVNMLEQTLWYHHTYSIPIYSTDKNNTFSVEIRKHHLKLSDFKYIHDAYPCWEMTSIWYLFGTIFAIIFSLFLFHQKKYKHLFCFIVFLSLILPTIYITKEDISKEENRNFSKFPSLFVYQNINEKFGIDFDRWFSDRFGGRKTLMDLRFFILYRINNRIENDSAFVGDENWIFPTKGIKKVDSLEKQHSENLIVINALKKISNTLKKKNIQIYLVIEPSRSILYKKYWDKYYPYIPYYDYIADLRKKLKKYPNIHLIDLEATFEKHKDTIRLYDKNDPHMTLPAVNLMIEEIVAALGTDIKTQYKKMITYQDKDCKLYDNINYYDHLLKIEPHNKKETCKEIIIKNPHIKTKELEVGINEAINSKPLINKDLYILFPCYEEFIFPILGEFYSNTISVNYNAFDKHDEETLRKHALEKLRAVKTGTTILIFLSHPTQYYISKSKDYLEAF